MPVFDYLWCSNPINRSARTHTLLHTTPTIVDKRKKWEKNVQALNRNNSLFSPSLALFLNQSHSLEANSGVNMWVHGNVCVSMCVYFVIILYCKRRKKKGATAAAATAHTGNIIRWIMGYSSSKSIESNEYVKYLLPCSLNVCVSENCYFSLVVPCARCGPTCVNWIGNFRICTNFFSPRNGIQHFVNRISFSLSVCFVCIHTFQFVYEQFENEMGKREHCKA